MMKLLDAIVAFFTATLSGTGVGGGGLYVVYLTLVKNIPQLQAQGINLGFFIAGALCSMLIHIPKRRIRFPLVLIVSLFGTLGSFFGVFLAHSLDLTLLSKIFGGMLILCGARTFFRKVKK